MRRSYILLFLAFLAATSCSDSFVDGGSDWLLNSNYMAPPDTSAIEAGLLDQYRRDAAILAMEYINRRDSSMVRIPQRIVKPFYYALIHVYNSDLEDAKVIKSIHPDDYRAPFEITFVYDQSANWGEQWAVGNRFSGNETIDQLIETYDLQFEDFTDLGGIGRRAVEFSSRHPLKMEALARLFRQQTPISDIVYGYNYFDGPDLKASVTNRFMEFTYELGFGDCPAGCINRHYWEVRVFRFGGVELIREYGDPLYNRHRGDFK